MPNYQFPSIAFTHGQSYMNGDCRTELGVNAVDVGAHHVNVSGVVDWVVSSKTPVYLRNDGAFGYSTAKGYYQSWKGTSAAAYVRGMTLLDEPIPSTGPAATLAADAQAFREVFPGLPVILNLNCFGAVAYNYAQVVQPDFLSYEIYMQATDDCSWVARYTGANDDVNFICNQARDVFANGGMSLERNQRIMIVFGTYGFGRCIAERAAAGTVFGDDMFYQMFSKTASNLGNYFGGVKNYAWCTDVESQLHGDHTPYEHAYVRPYIRTFNNLVYDANLPTPWPVNGATPPSNNGAVVITSFTADDATIAPGNSTTLRWSVSNAVSLSINQGIGAVVGTSHVVSPGATITYVLTATGGDGMTTTASVTVTVSSGGTLGTNSPEKIYANGVLHIKLINANGRAITNLRPYYMVGNWQRAGAWTIDAGGSGFVYTAFNLIGPCVFVLEIDGTPDALEVFFEQIARPFITPVVLTGVVGEQKILTLSVNNNETITGVSSSNTSVATATWSGNTATVTLEGAGTATIVITPSVGQGFNPSDFLVSASVDVEGKLNNITGTGTAIFTANAVCELTI